MVKSAQTETNNQPTPTTDYVVNMYNTTSRALINGKRPHLFQEVITKIAHSVNFNLVNKINETLRTLPKKEQGRPTRDRKPTLKALEAEQTIKKTKQKSSGNRNVTPPKQRKRNSEKKVTDAGLYMELDMEPDSGSSVENDDEPTLICICRTCNVEIVSDAVTCDICYNTLHYECEKLTEQEVNDYQNEGLYNCIACY
jgi:hypothetical protein